MDWEQRPVGVPFAMTVHKSQGMVFLFGSDKAVEKSCKSVVSRETGFTDPES